MADVLNSVDTTVGAGAFNRRVSFQLPSGNATDGVGSPVPNYTTVLTTWAHIQAWKGRKDVLASQFYATEYQRVLLRYRPSMNITTKMRMLYGRRVFDVTSVSTPAEAQTTIELLVTERKAYGSLH